MLLIINLPTNATATETEIQALTNSDLFTHSSCHNSEEGFSLSFISDKYFFGENEHINVSFICSQEITAISPIIDRTTINILSLEIDKNDERKINAVFYCPKEVKCYTFWAEITLLDTKVLYAKMYAYKTDCGIFISEFSEDDATVKFVDYAKKNNISLSNAYKDVREEVLNNITSTNISTNTNSSSNTNIKATSSSTGNYITGKLEWVDDAGNSHPLRRVKIDIYYRKTIGFGYLGNVYSNDSGEFSHYVSEGSGIFKDGKVTVLVFVYAGDDNIMVKNGLIEDYYFASEEKTLYLNGDPLEIEMCEDMDSDLGRAFQISQAIITARDYATTMMGETPNPVSIIYPMGEIDTYYYSENNPTIHITGNEPVASFPTSHGSWDMIMHEYGHHIQYQLNLIDYPEGITDHKSYINHADNLKNKWDGIRLAWAESWPTVFGLMAQEHYADRLLNIAHVGTAQYSAFNGITYNLEYNLDCLGEACERSIMAVLWDLYDKNNDTNDTIFLDHQDFWNSTTSYGSKYFANFIYHFYDDYPEFIDNLGPNLSFYKMAPSLPTSDSSTTVSQSIPPKFKWSAQGGSNEYGNKFFKLIFYDSRGDKILETETVTSTSYTLSQSQWNTILYSYGSTYNVAVAGLQTFDIGTDNQYEVEYISAQSSFEKPDSNNISITINLTSGTKIREYKQSLQPGQTAIFKFKFTTGGTWLIQTFGGKDTKFVLYSYNGSTLARNDDSGYGRNSLITYTFEPGVIYSLNVTFYDPEDAGTFKLVMTPANGTSQENGSITHYENICTINNTTSINLSSTLYPNQTQAFVFVPPETGSYTFTITSNFDTYIYVLHPGYTEEYVYNADCNDDSGDGANPLLIKRLTAGVPYFIICSAYNPNSETQSNNFSLVIYKND